MRNTDYFKSKKVTVLGLARSGLACANLLYDLGAEVFVTDNNDSDSTRLNAKNLRTNKIKVELGKHSPEFIKDRELIVISPGIPDTALPLVWAKQYKIPMISEIEVASILCPATIIATTGTNGKTTVSTLLGKILEAKGERVFVCGNIGNPFSGALDKMTEGDFVSLEVSSFQLEHIRTFKPKISVILNFSHNHLDRYNNIEEYLAAKKRIFMNQDKYDYLVLNQQDPAVRELAKEARAKAVYFSEKPGLNINQAAVLSVATLLGIEEETVLNVFKGFLGIEHRLEYVAQINNVKFINDSKATTADSTGWALKNISCPIILIAGGRDKGLDYSVISALARKKVKVAILIGEAKEKIKNSLNGSLVFLEAADLQEAVNKAYRQASSGDCVLLSPMCSSFDMFSDYEERGRVFKKAVYELMTNVKIQSTK